MLQEIRQQYKILEGSAQLFCLFVITVFLDFYLFSDFIHYLSQRLILYSKRHKIAGVPWLIKEMWPLKAITLLIGCMAWLRKQLISWLFLYPGTSWYSHQPISSLHTLETTSAEAKQDSDRQKWENYKKVRTIEIHYFFTFLFTSTSFFENKTDHTGYLL